MYMERPPHHETSTPASSIAYSLLNKVKELESDAKIKDFTLLQLREEIRILKEKLIVSQATTINQC